MGEFTGRIFHYMVAPSDIIYSVASALLYPVLFLEVAGLIWVAYQAGVVTVEAYKRRRARRSLDVDLVAAEAASARASGDGAKVIDLIRRFEWGPVLGPVTRLLTTRKATRLLAIKAMGDAERSAMRIMDRTRLMVRLGPTLGLMGTLIPISPALVGLAKGDTQTLSANLVVAFSTTVVGLLIGAIAYVTSVARERMYAQDKADIEYVLEMLWAAK